MAGKLSSLKMNDRTIYCQIIFLTTISEMPQNTGTAEDIYPVIESFEEVIDGTWGTRISNILIIMRDKKGWLESPFERGSRDAKNWYRINRPNYNNKQSIWKLTQKGLLHLKEDDLAQEMSSNIKRIIHSSNIPGSKARASTPIHKSNTSPPPAGKFSKPDETELQIENESKNQNDSHFFNPTSSEEGRQYAIRSIVQRRGQPAFRQKLIELYDGTCAVTGTNAIQALEACHIIPYNGEKTNHPSNGLLLRADIHTLFDYGLITINPSSMTILISDSLLNTSYSILAGKKIHLPIDKNSRPSFSALKQHRTDSGL